MNLNIIKKLIIVANTLDQNNLFKEADALDQIIKKLAVPIEGYTSPVGNIATGKEGLGEGVVQELTKLGRSVIWIPATLELILTNHRQREKFFADDLFGKSEDYKKLFGDGIFSVNELRKKIQSVRLITLVQKNFVDSKKFLNKYPDIQKDVNKILKEKGLDLDKVVLLISNNDNLFFPGIKLDEKGTVIQDPNSPGLSFDKDPEAESHDFWHGEQPNLTVPFKDFITEVLNNYKYGPEVPQELVKYCPKQELAYSFLRRDGDDPVVRKGFAALDSEPEIYRYLSKHGPNKLKSDFIIPEIITTTLGEMHKIEPEKFNEPGGEMQKIDSNFNESGFNESGLRNAWNTAVDKAYEWIQQTTDSEGKRAGPYSQWEGKAIIHPFL